MAVERQTWCGNINISIEIKNMKISNATKAGKIRVSMCKASSPLANEIYSAENPSLPQPSAE